jgi:hypothetical protein
VLSRTELLRTPHARVLVSLALLAMVLRTPYEVWGDTWFNLVLGREIAAGGLVVRNTLTEQGFGVPCVDQQWLAHATYYAIATHFGLEGVVVVASVVTAGAFVAAVGFALVGGATPGRTLALGVVALGVIMSQTVARAQTLAVPFLIAFPVVLARDARSPSRRTWWLVPCAAVWANLHGSVLLAPVMGWMLLVGRAVDAQRRREPIARRLFARDALLTASFAAAVFASPYAARLPAYYRSTVTNPAFRAYISEWQPPSPTQAPGALLLCAIVFMVVVASIRVMPTFESSLAVLLAMGTLNAERYATPLALVAAALLPRWADSALGAYFRVESDRVLQIVSRALLPVSMIAFAGIPFIAAHAIHSQFSGDFTDRVAAAADGHGHILADEAHADRLLWFHPELEGRVSHDARVETLPVDFLRALARAYDSPDAPASRTLRESYDVVVVDRKLHGRLFESMRRDPGWAPLAADGYASAFVARAAAEPPR